ncbi:hypothetical protein SODALDRAFT_374504 [Sodiomyces alkalinus F11]|uniref:U4/U6.U5 small nuclear ribonucleoprotein 27kDa protein domain-containing protein n=1 Tax=Sodiomyces alkalinus (strain CBS 110278 / VKM F-3762 / F11) TaxID=1314773 RepID=A0A3N2Q5T9_SODAK|nr:hypothetical protein SODALDRAFT_374504 [Sodiomyces alkalinus F11]ROT42141.1 hypothetical protein SODALDRAFT_374504 [Sodiomyces alkalinus F11]
MHVTSINTCEDSIVSEFLSKSTLINLNQQHNLEALQYIVSPDAVAGTSQPIADNATIAAENEMETGLGTATGETTGVTGAIVTVATDQDHERDRTGIDRGRAIGTAAVTFATGQAAIGTGEIENGIPGIGKGGLKMYDVGETRMGMTSNYRTGDETTRILPRKRTKANPIFFPPDPRDRRRSASPRQPTASPPPAHAQPPTAHRPGSRQETTESLPTRVRSGSENPRKESHATMSFKVGGRHDSPYAADSGRSSERPDSGHGSPMEEDRRRGGRGRGRGESEGRGRDDGGDSGGDDDVDVEVDGDEDAMAMAAMMGFGGFGTTKGKKIVGNNVGGVRKEKKSEYRQYMNRQGGFNRPLSPTR